MKRVFLFTILVVMMVFGNTVNIFAQKHARNWYFGNKAGLVFDGRYPMPLTDGQMNAREGVASISDSLGNLLCYSDGITVWNGAHVPIAQSLTGHSSSTMSAYFVKHPNNDSQYYLFTTSQIDNTPGADNAGCHYYLFDFSEENPDGKMVENHSDSPLQQNSTEKILAIPFGAQKVEETGSEGFWVITHEYETKTFNVFELSDSIFLSHSIDVGSVHGSMVPDAANKAAVGYMKASLQGDKVAVAAEGLKVVEIFNFNQNNGQLSLWNSIPCGDSDRPKEKVHGLYSLAFSPQGRCLYGTSKEAGVIYQWDLANHGLLQGDGVRIIRNRAEFPCGALQLAENGRIYVALENQDYMGVINRPDRVGFGDLGPHYNEYGARLINNETGEGGVNMFGLPQFGMQDYEMPYYNYETSCEGDTIEFYLSGINGYSRNLTSWEILDLETQMPYFLEIDDEFLTATWTAPPAGKFLLKLNTRYNSLDIQIRDTIIVHKPREIVLTPTDTTLFCKGDSLLLDAGNGAFYAWDDRDLRERYNWVSLPDMLGTPLKEFRVEVVDYNGCVSKEVVYLWIKNPPSIDTVYTKRATCGNLNGRAEVIPTGGPDKFDFRWEAFDDNFSNIIEGVSPGDYVVYYKQKVGKSCEASHLITIGELGVATAEIEPSTRDTICPGETVKLTVVGEGATDYQWVNPAGVVGKEVDVNPMVTSEYEVLVIAREGEDHCETNVKITIPVQTVVEPEMEPEYHACEGETISLVAPDGYMAYSWSNSMTGQNIELFEERDNLILTVLDRFSCASSDTMSVYFHSAPEVNLGNDQVLCTNELIPLSGGEGQEYIWNTGETAHQIEVNQSGSYWVMIGDSGCFSSDTVEMSFLNPDSLIIDSVKYWDISCYGANDGKIEMSVHGQGSDYLYSIDGGETYFDNDGEFSNLSADKVYELKVMEDSICFRGYDEIVEIEEPEEISYSFQKISPSCADCYDGKIILKDLTGGVAPYTIQWDNHEYGPRLTGAGVGMHVVSITDAKQCMFTEELMMEVRIKVPNAFTPNGDGLNDNWDVKVIDPVLYPLSSAKVYDLRGRLVFESTPGQLISWDGKLNGEHLSTGTYYYIITVVPGQKPYTGNLTLIR